MTDKCATQPPQPIPHLDCGEHKTVCVKFILYQATVYLPTECLREVEIYFEVVFIIILAGNSACLLEPSSAAVISNLIGRK